MTRNKQSQPDWDDGRVICPMDVDGMPWKKERSFFKRPSDEAHDAAPHEQMTGQQTRYYTAGALKAALLMVGVFSIALVLFTLFCTNVWLRVK